MSHILRKIPHLQTVLKNCPLVVCDLWGVLHNGVQAHPAAIDALYHVKKCGIPVALLSNAPKSVDHVTKFLRHLGVPDDIYDVLVTSGSIAQYKISQQYARKKVFLMGYVYDEEVLNGLQIELIDTLEDAEVILTCGLMADDAEGHREMLQKPLENGAVMIIANPDRVVHVGEDLLLCAGVVGDLYAEMGGTVVWCGKPTREAFQMCAQKLGLSFGDLQGKALMIGDSIKTDMMGAKNAGFKSLLITNGIHREDAIFQKHCAIERDIFTKTFGPAAPLPEYWMPRLQW